MVRGGPNSKGDVDGFVAHHAFVGSGANGKSGAYSPRTHLLRKRTRMLSMDDLFKGRQFDREIIILCVRWYLRFKLSFRDLVEMMAERGISLAHTTITLDSALCSGVRKAVEPFRLPGRHILAGRRNLCEDQRQVDISLPCCRQARKDGGFSAPRQAGCCSCQSVFPAGVQEPGPAATKDHARRLSGFASGGAGNPWRTSAREAN